MFCGVSLWPFVLLDNSLYLGQSYWSRMCCQSSVLECASYANKDLSLPFWAAQKLGYEANLAK